MTEVTFVASIQGHQVERTREFAERMRKAHPDVVITVVEGDAAAALLLKHKLKFGPAVVINGRLEYVGIPRWRHLQERLAQILQSVPNPRTAVAPEKPAAVSSAPTRTAAAPSAPASAAKPARSE